MLSNWCSQRNTLPGLLDDFPPAACPPDAPNTRPWMVHAQPARRDALGGRCGDAEAKPGRPCSPKLGMAPTPQRTHHAPSSSDSLSRRTARTPADRGRRADGLASAASDTWGVQWCSSYRDLMRRSSTWSRPPTTGTSAVCRSSVSRRRHIGARRRRRRPTRSTCTAWRRTPAAGSSRCPSAWTTRTGSRIRASTVSSTSARSPSPRPAPTVSWSRSCRASRRDRSTDRDRCGRCTSSRGWTRAASSPSTPRPITARSTARPAPSSCWQRCN